MSYEVKLIKKVERNNFFARFVEIKGYPYPPFNFKIPRVTENELAREIPFRELWLQTSVSKLLNIRNNKDAEEEAKKSLNKKLSSFYYILIPTVEVDVPNFSLDDIMSVLNDIYYSRVNFFTPPKFYVKNLDEQARRELMNYFLSSIDFIERLGKKPFMLVPYYLSIADVDNTISKYNSKFGADSFYVIDCKGNAFSTYCYSLTASVMRNMTNLRIDDFGIYLFDLKPYKRSKQNRAPSEEFLGILSGANIIGPRHTVTPISQEVAEKIHQTNPRPKVFNRQTLFYEVTNTMINDYEHAAIYSDNEILKELKQNFTRDKDIELSLSGKNDFVVELSDTYKKIKKNLRQGSLISFI